ncbi:hypothetical protein BLNAU_14097 [Blattamonas nauphoetae]|uniref:Uncharacterized protein n=1 Tax=Blattamonas nauphoetae TaxID=2049346 RepID=A0ABQ9XI65_9EUKA|nr:hypothetical protein BLNAU_14097 [Blattamonas nauphoetae]
MNPRALFLSDQSGKEEEEARTIRRMMFDLASTLLQNEQPNIHTRHNVQLRNRESAESLIVNRNAEVIVSFTFTIVRSVSPAPTFVPVVPDTTTS